MDRESTSRIPFGVKSVFLAISIATCISLLFYSVTATATADPNIRPYATAIGIALAVIFIIAGIIDKETAKEGLLFSLISVIPRLYRWSVQSNLFTFFTGIASLSLAGAALWLGPIGVTPISIACDEAETVKISDREDSHACQGALSKNLWRSPLERTSPTSIICFDKQGNSWQGKNKTQTTGVCGARPKDARYVSNGIPDPKLESDTVVGRRTLEGIDRLRKALNDQLPDRRLKDRLLFATWNIRDLGRKRLEESYAYIAEIISHFDIVAIQEVRERAAVDRILNYLGDGFKAEFGFFSPGIGSKEQIGFIYDSRKVGLGKISTTLVVDSTNEELSSTGQPIRPPFLSEFVINGKPLFIVNSHIYFGSIGGEKFERRLAELRIIASTLEKIAKKHFPDHPLLLAGDLNIGTSNGREMQTLLDNGFITDQKLAELNTDSRNNHPYDQILALDFADAPLHFGEVGVFPVFNYVFRDNDWSTYKIDFMRLAPQKLKDKDQTKLIKQYQNQLRISQMSDHFPKWAAFRLDNKQ